MVNTHRAADSRLDTVNAPNPAEMGHPVKHSLRISCRFARFIAVLLLIVILAPPVYALSEQKVTVYLFWGTGCPHCAREKEFLKHLGDKYPRLEVKSYEVWYNKKNADFFLEMSSAYGFTPRSVPVTFVGDFPPMAGFLGEEMHGRILEDRIRYCTERGCADPVRKLGAPSKAKQEAAEEDSQMVLPLVGKINTDELALPVLTVLIAGMDGFNPCAFFVLFLLLSLLVYAESRRKILLIGGTFVFFSGLIYFVFMAAWLNIFLLMGQVRVITVAAGVIAVLIAALNVKDFFLFKKGMSLTIPEGAKPKLFERMRGLLKAPSLTSMMIGTVILAAAANAYELLCTAGFPMVYTRVLTLRALPQIENYLYLVFYNIIYVVPLSVIVVVFALTLGARRLTEWQGRVLKLVSGLMMFCLGLLLLGNPDLLGNVAVSAGLIALSLTAAGVIVVLDKKLNRSLRR